MLGQTLALQIPDRQPGFRKNPLHIKGEFFLELTVAAWRLLLFDADRKVAVELQSEMDIVVLNRDILAGHGLSLDGVLGGIHDADGGLGDGGRLAQELKRGVEPGVERIEPGDMGNGLAHPEGADPALAHRHPLDQEIDQAVTQIDGEHDRILFGQIEEEIGVGLLKPEGIHLLRHFTRGGGTCTAARGGAHVAHAQGG